MFVSINCNSVIVPLIWKRGIMLATALIVVRTINANECLIFYHKSLSKLPNTTLLYLSKIGKTIK